MKFVVFILGTFICYGGWCQLNVGLIAQYNFDGNANDISGNNLHGSVLGPILVSDREGNPSSAYSFDGVDDIIEVPNFPISHNTYSFCAWVKSGVNINSGNSIVTQLNELGTSSSMTGFGLAVGSTNKYSLRHMHDPYSYSDIYVSSTIDQDWHFIVGTYNGDTMKIYLDNIFQFSADTITASAPKLDTLCIGFERFDNLTYTSFFNGIIDDIRVYDRALNECEIHELYTGLPCDLSLIEISKPEKNLIKITDFFGRETKYKPNTLQIYIYSDGTTEKVFRVE